MSNIETVSVASLSPKSTFNTGFSLVASLYPGASIAESTLRSAGSVTCATHLTIFLQGDLGSGKTTFVQGLGKGLGVDTPIVSPTYALENRYDEKLLHMDLFRIEPKEARKMLEMTEDFPGVRVIEWSERLEVTEGTDGTEGAEVENKNSSVPFAPSVPSAPSISISLTDLSPTTRNISITFADISWPDQRTIEAWRNEVKLPDHIRKHCDAVGAFAKTCAEELLRRGIVARPQALEAAGKLHDLLRFIDFQNVLDRSLHPEWVALAEKYQSSHEEACSLFLEEHGFGALAEIIRPHGLRSVDAQVPFRTIEQKLLFYADKRVMGDRVVSLDERFTDFIERYGKGVESEVAKRWRLKTEELEQELFGTDVPS